MSKKSRENRSRLRALKQTAGMVPSSPKEKVDEDAVAPDSITAELPETDLDEMLAADDESNVPVGDLATLATAEPEDKTAELGDTQVPPNNEPPFPDDPPDLLLDDELGIVSVNDPEIFRHQGTTAAQASPPPSEPEGLELGETNGPQATELPGFPEAETEPQATVEPQTYRRWWLAPLGIFIAGALILWSYLADENPYAWYAFLPAGVHLLLMIAGIVGGLALFISGFIKRERRQPAIAAQPATGSATDEVSPAEQPAPPPQPERQPAHRFNLTPLWIGFAVLLLAVIGSYFFIFKNSQQIGEVTNNVATVRKDVNDIKELISPANPSDPNRLARVRDIDQRVAEIMAASGHSFADGVNDVKSRFIQTHKTLYRLFPSEAEAAAADSTKKK